MAEQIIPQDIQEDANKLFTQSDRIEEMNDHLPQRAIYIKGRFDERKKLNEKSNFVSGSCQGERCMCCAEPSTPELFALFIQDRQSKTKEQ